MVCFISICGFSKNCRINKNIKREKVDSISLSFYEPYLFKYLPYVFDLQLSDTANILIESDGANVERMSNGLYRINNSKSSYLNIYQAVDTGYKKIYSKFLRIHNPPITVFLNGKKTGDMINVNNFKNSTVSASLINFDFDFNIPIASFAILISLNNSLKTISTVGPQISDEQYEYIKKLSNLQPVILQINIKGIDGELESLAPVVFYVTK